MKITEINVKNTYSCLLCGKSFETPKEEQQPLCSYKCKFNLIYRALKEYDETKLKIVSELYGLKFSKEKLIFELTKVLMPILLKPVSPVSPFGVSGQSGHIRKREGTTQTSTKGSLVVHNTYMYGLWTMDKLLDEKRNITF